MAEQTKNVKKGEKKKKTKQKEEKDDCGDDGGGEKDVLSEKLANIHLDVWPKDKLDKELCDLHVPAIRSGNDYIYILWKSLLFRWLSSSDHKVYLATPFLDVERMTDIYQMVIKNHTKANIEDFFVRKKCYSNSYRKIYKDIDKIKEDSSNKIKKLDKTEDFSDIIKKKITDKLRVIIPKFKSGIFTDCFHAKFIGCVCNDRAEVLVTSANFTDCHFDIKNEESVVYFDIPGDQFVKRFVKPLKLLVT